MDAMAAAHAKDYGEKARIDTLRTVIRDFLDDPPSRFPERWQATLGLVAEELERESAQIVLVWS